MEPLLDLFQAGGVGGEFLAVLTQYNLAPAVTKDRLYIEMFEEVFGADTSTDLIDKNLENFIPLKQLTDAARQTGVQ